MLTESDDEEQIIGRVAALDIGKTEVLCCVRVPGAGAKRRRQEVSTHSTMTDHFTRHVNSEAKKRNHIRQLEALGYHVTLNPAA